MSKSRQSVECFRYFKQSALSESCRTDLSINEFIQHMHNTQVSFKAVQKDSDNNTMQIKKSNYINSKMYRLIALLNIMSKALKLIMIKRLSDIVETYHMLSNAQMRARCKQFMILTLNLLIDQVHTVWSCEIKHVIFMLSLNVVEAFNQVSHVRLLHMLKMKRMLSYIIK